MAGPTRKLVEGKGKKGPSKAQIGLKKIKEADKRAKKGATVPAKVPPGGGSTSGASSSPAKAVHPLITPAMVKAANSEIQTRRDKEDREHQDQVNAEHEARRAAERPTAPESNWLPWEPSKTGSVNSPTFQRDRRHQLDCAATWIYNFLDQEYKLYQAATSPSYRTDADIQNYMAGARRSILDAMEHFDRRAAEEAPGYKPIATVDMIRNGITQEEYEHEQKGVQDSRGSTSDIRPAL